MSQQTSTATRPTDLAMPLRKSIENEKSSNNGQNITLSNDSRFLELRDSLLRVNNVINLPQHNLRTTFDDFELAELIGKGTCGMVWKAKHTKFTDVYIAAKQMRLTSHSEENARIYSDLKVMLQNNDCIFIIKCYGISIMPSNFIVYIFMELMSTCLQDLSRQLNKPFPEPVIGKISVSIIEALDYLKSKFRVIHRDVKPSNMLLGSNGVVKLCDFGISGQLKDSIANSNRAGCIAYMSPERIRSTTYDARADIWACGISFVELFTNTHPYEEFKMNEFLALMAITSNPSPVLKGDYTPAFEQFINACLEKEVEKRPKYPELKNFEFYKMHAVPPFDICTWYRSLIFPTKGKSMKNSSQAFSPCQSIPTPTLADICSLNPEYILASPTPSVNTLSPLDDDNSLHFLNQIRTESHGTDSLAYSSENSSYTNALDSTSSSREISTDHPIEDLTQFSSGYGSDSSPSSIRSQSYSPYLARRCHKLSTSSISGPITQLDTLKQLNMRNINSNQTYENDSTPLQSRLRSLTLDGKLKAATIGASPQPRLSVFSLERNSPLPIKSAKASNTHEQSEIRSKTNQMSIHLQDFNNSPKERSTQSSLLSNSLSQKNPRPALQITDLEENELSSTTPSLLYESTLKANAEYSRQRVNSDSSSYKGLIRQPLMSSDDIPDFAPPPRPPVKSSCLGSRPRSRISNSGRLSVSSSQPPAGIVTQSSTSSSNTPTASRFDLAGGMTPEPERCGRRLSGRLTPSSTSRERRPFGKEASLPPVIPTNYQIRYEKSQGSNLLGNIPLVSREEFAQKQAPTSPAPKSSRKFFRYFR